MHIPMRSIQFTGENVLIVVMGSQRGLLYLAGDGNIDIIGTVDQPTPEYSDREGYFMHSGNGMVYGSGSVYEDKNIERVRRFFKRAAQEIFRIMRTYDIARIYVFEPLYAKGAVTETLRPLVRDDVTLVRYGNYLHEPATTLISFIERSERGERDPSDPATVDMNEKHAEEKRKILAHAMQAREVIGKV